MQRRQPTVLCVGGAGAFEAVCAELRAASGVRTASVNRPVAVADGSSAEPRPATGGEFFDRRPAGDDGTDRPVARSPPATAG